MRDCVGNELHVGDSIVACDGYYSELLLGTVVRFTQHQVVCKCVRANNQTGDYFETRKYPNQLHRVYYRKETEELMETVKSGKLPSLNKDNKTGIDYINKGANGFKF